MALTILSKSCFADTQTVKVNEDTSRIDLAKSTLSYKDFDNLSIEAVNQLSNSQFEPVKSDVFQGGFTKASYWLKFTIDDNRKSRDIKKDWLLIIDFPSISSATLYQQDSQGKWRSAVAGANESFDARQFKLRELAFSLETEQEKSKTYYVKINSSAGILVPLTLWDKNAYTEHHSYDSYAWGIYFGIFAAMFLYNLFLFISFKDSTYFYYVGYTLTCALSMAVLNGFGYHVLWPEYTTWNNISITVIIPVSFLFGIQFSRKYLQLSEFNKKLDKIMAYISIASLLPAIVAILTAKPQDSLIAVFAFIFASLLIYSGINSHLNGKRQARYFLLAWGLLLLFIGVYCAALFSIININLFLIQTLHLGAVLEVVLLSLGLADRINILKAERYQLQKQMTEISEKRNTELKKMIKSKDEFLATISHELRTPINGVLGAVTLLKKNPTEIEQEALLDSAERAGEDILEVIENILGFTEIQSSQLSIQQDIVQVDLLITCLINELKEKYKNDQLEINYSSNVPFPFIETDKAIVSKAIRLVTDNAFKFTIKGSILITTNIIEQKKEKLLEVKIQDSGIGIPESELLHVLKPFYQVDQSFSRHFGGLGMGLSIASRLVDLLKGKLTLESTPKEGTCATILFPIKEVEAHNQANQNKPTSTTNNRSDNATILIVEDNKTNMMVTKGIVKKLGYRFLCAENGKEAVDILRNNSASLILMDCQMPIMNGFEATEAIRKLENNNSKIPILAVTANAMLDDKQKCIDSGMNDHIAKPVKPNILKEKIEDWLKNVG